MMVQHDKPIEISKIRNYLEHKINNWYANTLIDYGVSGKFKGLKTCGEHLCIVYIEDGKEKEVDIVYYNDYTLEQLYNIWMETE